MSYRGTGHIVQLIIDSISSSNSYFVFIVLVCESRVKISALSRIVHQTTVVTDMSDDLEFIRTMLNEWKLSKWYQRFVGKCDVLIK